MRISRFFAMTAAAVLLTAGNAQLSMLPGAAPAFADAIVATPNVAVGPQYDSTHVYIAPRDLEAFVNSFSATFGGRPSKPSVTNVLPVPSSSEFQFLLTS